MIQIKSRVFIIVLSFFYFLFFWPYLKENFFIPKFYWGTIFTIFFLIIETLFLKKVSKSISKRQFWPAVLLLYLASIILIKGKWDFYHREAILELISFFLLFHLFYFLFTKEEKLFPFFEKTVLIFIFIVSIYGFFQWWGYDFNLWIKYQGKRRVFSTIGNPNFLSSVLLISLPYFFSKQLNKKFKLILILPLIVLILAKSFAVYSIVSLYLLFLLLTYLKRKYNLRKIHLIILIFSCFLLLGMLFHLLKLNDKKSPLGWKLFYKKNIRIFIWQTGLAALKNNFFLGSGIGDFKISFPYYLRKINSTPPPKNPYLSKRYHYLHFELYQAILEWGIIGFFIFLLFLKETICLKLLNTPAFIATILLTLHSFLSPVFHNPSIYFFLSAILAHGYINNKNKNIKFQEKRNLIGEKLILVFFLFLTLMGIYQMYKIRLKEGIIDILWKRGEWKKTYSLLKEAEECEPQLVSIHRWLGKYNLYVGDWNDSIVEFEKALKIWPDSDDYTGIGEAYLHQQKFEKALTFLLKASEFNFVSAKAKISNFLGAIYLAKKEYQKASHQYSITLNYVKKSARGPLFYNLALSFQARGLFKKALKYYQLAIKSSSLPPKIKIITAKQIKYLQQKISSKKQKKKRK